MIVPRKWDQETSSITAFHTRQFVTGTCRSDFLGQLTSPKSLIRVTRALCFGERREELHFIKSLWEVIICSWNWLLKKFSFRALPPFELKIYSSRNIPKKFDSSYESVMLWWKKRRTTFHKVAVRSHYLFLKLAVEKIFVPRVASIWIENLLIQKHTSWEKGTSCKSTSKNSTLQ